MKHKIFGFLIIVSVILSGLTGMLQVFADEPDLNGPDTNRINSGLSALESEVESVYEKVEPSVVNITTQSVSYNIFRQAVPQEGAGSGFLYDTKGDIVTNFHVIENAQSIAVNFGNGKVLDATIVGTDPSNDLAVIKVSALSLPQPVVIADSGNLKVGQFVIALGNPFGLDGTLTFGVISALGRTIQSPNSDFIGESIQTDAPINPGNSGGPLLNLKGQVIGVNSQIMSPSGSSAGVGFAISSNTVKRVIPELIAHGKYPHPWLGISGVDVGPEWKDIFKEAGFPLPVVSGILVMEVDKNSPAGKTGLSGGTETVQIGNYRFPMGGDIITALDSTPVATMKELDLFMETKSRIGEQLEITYYRGAKKLTGTAVIIERPQE
jgi:S1-C subfamily serine protease